jgi:Predicted permease.
MAQKDRNTYYTEFNYVPRTYAVNFNNGPSKTNIDLLLKQLESISNLPETVEIVVQCKLKSSKDITVCGYFSYKDIFYITEGRKFNHEEQEIGEKVVIASKNLFDYSNSVTHLGEKLNIEGDLYKIVGVAQACPDNTAYIPYKTFINNHFSIERFTICFAETLNTNQENVFMKFINDRFGTLQKPAKVNFNEEKLFYLRILSYFLLIVLAAINTMSLMKYWFNKNLNKFIIFRICGSSKAFTYFFIMFEVILFYFVTFCLSFLLYKLSKPVLAFCDAYYQMNTIDIFSCAVITLISMVLIVDLVAVRIAKMTDIYKFY